MWGWLEWGKVGHPGSGGVQVRGGLVLLDRFSNQPDAPEGESHVLVVVAPVSDS